MSTEFTIDIIDEIFTIGIEFSNDINIYFESDLNNLSREEIKDFMKKFKRNKKCRLDIINTVKNQVVISYNPKENKIHFITFGEDIKYNHSEVNIGFKIDEEEHDNFCNILEELDEYMVTFTKVTFTNVVKEK